MARVIPAKARTVKERNVVYRMGHPVEIQDEELYYHLIRSGKLRNADQELRPIDPVKILPKLRPGTYVTVVREQGLGDVLMVLVVIRALKARYPELQFSLATGRWYLPILGSLDFLAQVESLFEMRGHRGNVIDLRNVPERSADRESVDRIEIFARACGIEVQDYSLPLCPVPDEARRDVRGTLGDGPVIALAVRGSTHVRTWPIENVRRFAMLAAQSGWTVAVLDGARFDMPEHRLIRNLTGEIGLEQSVAVIAESEFCISPDSGLQHIAEAVGTKCLALYSTTPPALRIGHYRHVKAIWRESLPCVPCFDRGCPAAPCMRIAPEVVLRGIENWENLAMATNVDASVLPIAPVIRIEREAQIMESWPRCVAV